MFTTVGGNIDGVLPTFINQTTGVLAKISGSPFTSKISAPFGLTVDPTGRFLFVVDSVTGSTPLGITVFAIDPNTGGLSVVAGPPFAPPAGGAQLQAVAIDPTGRFAYLVNTAGTCCLSSYKINSSTGALSKLSTSPYPTGPGSDPFDITLIGTIK